jgi:hypothetical protein
MARREEGWDLYPKDAEGDKTGFLKIPVTRSPSHFLWSFGNAGSVGRDGATTQLSHDARLRGVSTVSRRHGVAAWRGG